jgi:hypothetical protein
MHSVDTLKLSSLFSILLFCLLCAIGTPYSASASFLSLSNITKLSLKKSSQGITISGTIEILNNGDEIAQNVQPVLIFNKVKTTTPWMGATANLSPRTSYTWNVNYQIPTSELSCKTPLCDEYKGAFPLFIKLLYQDTNGYKFSAPSIYSLTTENLTADESVEVSRKDINPKLECSGNGEFFSCLLTTLSQLKTTIPTTVQIFSSDELIISPELIKLFISPSPQESVAPFQVSNNSGLQGSSYPVTAEISWRSPSGINNFTTATILVSLQKPRNSLVIFGIGLGIFVLAFTCIAVRVRYSKLY